MPVSDTHSSQADSMTHAPSHTDEHVTTTALATVQKKKRVWRPIPSKAVARFVRLVESGRYTQEAAAAKVGYSYTGLIYARNRIARAKGLKEPPPLRHSYARLLPSDMYHDTPKYERVDLECVKEVNKLVKKYRVTIKEALRSLGFEDLVSAQCSYQYWTRVARKRAAAPPPRFKYRPIPKQH